MVTKRDKRRPEEIPASPDAKWTILCEDYGIEVICQYVICSLDACSICETTIMSHWPRHAIEATKGKSALIPTLEGHTFNEVLRRRSGILIVVDSDKDPVKEFSDVCKSLRKAGFPVPNECNVQIREEGHPSVMVVTIPDGRPGNIEVACLPDLFERLGHQELVESFIDNSEAKPWDENKKAKATVHALIAVTCRERPDCHFNNHWGVGPRYQPNLANDCYTGLVSAIRSVVESCG